MKKRKRPFLFGHAPLGVAPIGVGGGYRVELDAGQDFGRVLVSGAEHIIRCKEEEVVFSVARRYLVIRGASLGCITYDGGVAEVEGEISGIFLMEKGEI